MTKSACCGIVCGMIVLFFAQVYAAAPYYEDKTVRFLVAFAPGGGFDTYTRAIARHMGSWSPLG